MNSGEIIIFIIIAVVLVAFPIWWRWGAKRRIVHESAVPIPQDVPYAFRTPGGVSVSSVTNYVPDAALEAIDEGIRNQIERISAAHPEWAARANLVDYRVMFINPMAENVETDPGSPALIVYGIQSAGTCVGIGGDGFTLDFIVLPHQVDTSWAHIDYLMHSAWYESEHIREWFNDTAVFNSFLGTGDIHPHFP